MEEHIVTRIEQLVSQGQEIARSYSPDDYWIKDVPRVQSWLASAVHVILQISPPASFYHLETARLTNQEDLKRGITVVIVEKVLGLLLSVQSEASAGFLSRLEYQVFATAFDDFLDHADFFYKSGKAKEAAILVSAVLEDVLKRVAEKHDIDAAKTSLEPLVNQLGIAQVLSEVKVKRVKSYIGVRNAAYHAIWDELDLKDIGQAIGGVRELIEMYL